MAQKTEFMKGLAANLVIVLALQSVCWGQNAGSQIAVMTPAGTTHEMVHVRQYERWGPFFIPAYLACSLGLWLAGKDAYRDNPFEREAYGR